MDNQGDRLIGFLKVKTIGKNPYEYVIIVREDFLTNPLSGVDDVIEGIFVPFFTDFMERYRVTNLHSLKSAIDSLLPSDEGFTVEISDVNPSQVKELNEIVELPLFLAQLLRGYLVRKFGLAV